MCAPKLPTNAYIGQWAGGARTNDSSNPCFYRHPTGEGLDTVNPHNDRDLTIGSTDVVLTRQ